MRKEVSSSFSWMFVFYLIFSAFRSRLQYASHLSVLNVVSLTGVVLWRSSNLAIIVMPPITCARIQTRCRLARDSRRKTSSFKRQQHIRRTESPTPIFLPLFSLDCPFKHRKRTLFFHLRKSTVWLGETDLSEFRLYLLYAIFPLSNKQKFTLCLRKEHSECWSTTLKLQQLFIELFIISSTSNNKQTTKCINLFLPLQNSQLKS